MRPQNCIPALVLAVALTVPSFAMADPVEDGNAGLTALQQGDYKHAISLFTRALASSKLTGDDREFAYSQRGTAYLKDGAYTSAISDFEHALKLKPDDADAKSGLEDARSHASEASARRSESSGRTESPAGATQAAQSGMEALNNGDYARAIILFTRAINSGRLSDDDRELALLSRGKAYLQKSQYTEAVYDLNKALGLKADDQEAQAAFAKALSQVRARTPAAAIDGPTCMKNFSTVGSIISGKTYTSFAEYPTLSTFDAFAGTYTALTTYTPVPGMAWQIAKADLNGGSIKGSITFTDSGRAISLDVRIDADGGGSKITMTEVVPGLLPTIDLKGTMCATLADAPKG
jgi:tetratricopeptide (TPR) repeat protein